MIHVFRVPPQTSYIQPQAHPYDLYFYNGTDYTVERCVGTCRCRSLGSECAVVALSRHGQFSHVPFTVPPPPLRYLSDVTERYGGIDSILLWPHTQLLGLMIAISL